MKKTKLLLLLSVVLSAFACQKDLYPELNDGIYAEFDTNQGKFVTQLYYKATPLTVANFVSLAEGNNTRVDEKFKGKKYYDGLIFHRVIDNFMIQGGDPTGTGSGGPGYKFQDEFVDSLKHDTKGVLSMANAGPETNGSQFFITLKATPHLNGRHTIFGKVVIGQDVVDKIGKVKTLERDKPVADVVINHVTIIRKGKEAKAFDANKTFEEITAKIEEEKKLAEEELKKKLENLTKDGFEKTSSGLFYKITKNNPEGKKPTRGNEVEVHYTGKLTDGTKFDSSVDRGKPLKFPVGTGRVIAGWDEGIMLLKEGEKATFIIPPHIGYGERNVGPIPANSTLIFDVELVKAY